MIMRANQHDSRNRAAVLHGRLELARLDQAADIARRAKSMPSGSELIAPAGRRILVADDSVDVCETLSQLLRGLGHEVCAAFEGVGALALARTWQPEVVVLDVVMPGMNGFAVARALRAQFSADRMRIVMMSGYALDEATLKNAGEAGFDACLDKAFTMEDLRSAIDGAGEEHALR
jgi:CheY-like chemotaxis protein